MTPAPSSNGQIPGQLALVPQPPTNTSWSQGAGTTYDEVNFYTRASDAAGHHEIQRLRLRPELAHAVQALVASRTFPAYRTSHDLIRDAVVHRLHWLEANTVVAATREALIALTERLEFEEFVAEIQAEMAAWRDSQASLTLAMETLVGEEDWDALAAMAERIEDRADGMREPYGSRVLAIAKQAKAQIPAGVWESWSVGEGATVTSDHSDD